MKNIFKVKLLVGLYLLIMIGILASIFTYGTYTPEVNLPHYLPLSVAGGNNISDFMSIYLVIICVVFGWKLIMSHVSYIRALSIRIDDSDNGKDISRPLSYTISYLTGAFLDLVWYSIAAMVMYYAFGIDKYTGWSIMVCVIFCLIHLLKLIAEGFSTHGDENTTDGMFSLREVIGYNLHDLFEHDLKLDEHKQTLKILLENEN